MKKKAKNRQDATLVNVRSAGKRLAKLEQRVKDVELVADAVVFMLSLQGMNIEIEKRCKAIQPKRAKGKR